MMRCRPSLPRYFPKPPRVDHVIAAQIHQRILHLDILDIGNADGWIVHVAAGRDTVAIGRRAEARAVHVVDALPDRVAVLVLAAIHETRTADVETAAAGAAAIPGGIDVLLQPGRVQHLGDARACRRREEAANAGRAAALQLDSGSLALSLPGSSMSLA